jgi:enoyl-CoA hydratase/carnithine racemase
MRDLANYMRQNPQVLVLLVICVVLGIGTFLAVIIALITASSGTNTGEPSGTIGLLHGLLAALG